ncbi:uncharacterized protein UTRI_10437_B [Ustilago trichophora]|uniref:Uncharacterized protein n=1 Tax=Ustilago trichophora TaxID=86804 RepID=A0A5C3E8U1_9BASI|nr:uncharacterized protein UTRI_10437_B [Ustilago trichophora]
MPHEYDFDMWLGAQEEYRRAHKGRLFLPQHVGLDSYDDIFNLKGKILYIAESAGRMRGAMKIGVRGTHEEGNRAIWFSTVIHPRDFLAEEMMLGDRTALALWRIDKDGEKLLTMDTVPNLDLRFGLEDLHAVLRQF